MMAQRIESNGKLLATILEGIVSIAHHQNVVVEGLSLDSKAIKPGYCFVALQGSSGHGLQHLDEATAAGASAILCDEWAQKYMPEKVGVIPIIVVEGLRERLAVVSNRFFDYPSKRISTVAITGTNGKTTIGSIIAVALQQTNGAAAYIGTLGAGLWHNLEPSANTTPDLLTVQHYLASFNAQGIKSCAMEVSSHALAQGRVDGIQFDVAVFSNLTHEHLDYHGSMEAYGKAKQRLFTNDRMQGESPAGCDQQPLANAVINVDDPFGREILQKLDPSTVKWPYGVSVESGRYPRLTTATEIDMSLDGISMRVSSPAGEGVVRSKLIGHFNVSNLLATIASLGALQWTFSEIKKALANVSGVPGRMDVISLASVPDLSLPTVVIDYAHTPDALEQALESLRDLTQGRLICVFGCGGDRDQEKRARMGAIAEKLADSVVVTSDNPRSEVPRDIIMQIISGQVTPQATLVEEDRETAIRHAIKIANPKDVVLIAGKGHESYQIFGAERVTFSDHEVSRIALCERYVGNTR